jgi:hypothetical protein
MKTNFSLLSLLILPFAGVAVASNTVTYDFDSSSVGDVFTNGGVSGWTQSNSNPEAFGQSFPLAYIASSNFGGGGSNAAHLGTQFANTPDNSNTIITGDLSSLTPYNMMSASLDMAVIDDSADAFLGRDAFSVALTTAAGNEAATIGFNPTTGNNEQWDVSVGVNGNTSTTGQVISAGAGYTFYINSRDNTTSFSFSAADDSGLTIGLGTVNGIVTDLNSVSGISFKHDTLSGAGTSAHTMVIEDISVQIPEPSSSLLMVLSAGLIAIRRRR